MEVDHAHQSLPEGVFSNFSLWIRVLEFATPIAICSFSQVCAKYNALVHVLDYDNESMWRALLKRDYQMTDSTMKRFAKAGLSFRSIFIAYCRSRISPVGSLSPEIRLKHVRRSEALQKWAKLHGLSPFYVAQLWHTSTHGPRTIVSKYTYDEESYYGQVLELRRCWNIQVEGAARVWRAGYYRLVWRLKLAKDYEDLGPLQFLCKVVESNAMKHLLPEEEVEKVNRQELSWTEEELVSPLRISGSHTVYVWNPPNPLPMLPPNPQDLAVHPNDRPFGAPEPAAQPQDDGFGLAAQQQLFQLHNRILQAQGQAQPAPALPAAQAAPLAPNDPAPPAPLEHTNAPFPVGEWFDLLAGFIHVPHAHDAVCFAMTNFTIGYKYGLMIDYVALLPITESEFNRQNRFPLGPMLMDDNHYWDSLSDGVLDQS
jgi:hypothetical protein